RVPGKLRTVEKVGGITVIYTKEAETADSYIERASYELASQYAVKVATSDYQEQLIVWGNGAVRMSAKELHDQVKAINAEITEIIDRTKWHG
ncbi:MAG: NYN domain-containing protein, partial [Clostridia bacterium]|nr:NYN domain-containing protein [Clostridia bacterium]